MSSEPEVTGSGAEILVEALIEAGAEVIFGVPGDTGVALYDALHRSGRRLTHVLAGDERGAAFMADAYARRSNRVGLVEVSSGGGACFAVGGLGESYAAGVPVLLISSDIHRRSRGSGALTETDQVALYQGVTKAQLVVPEAAELAGLIATGLRLAASGRPGPVALIVPEDVLDERAAVTIPPIGLAVPAERPAAPAAAVVTAAARLLEATRPVILAGSGVHVSGAHAELARLAEVLGAPVATTIHGKGSFSERHPLSLGVAGANGARPEANRRLAAADVALIIGSRANATDTDSFRSPPRGSALIIQVDIDPGRAGRNFPGSIGLVGDARTVLAQLLSRLPAAAGAPRSELDPGLWAAPASDSAPPVASDLGDRLDPAAVVGLLRRLAGDGLTVVGDPGTPTPYLAADWQVEAPGRRVLLPRGHGPMGYAHPAAIGAAMAVPGEPVIAVTTDGSLLMAAGALETAARLRVPVTYVQLTNRSLGWIKALQHFYYGGRYQSTDLSAFDTVGVARGFGVEATRVGSLEEFEAAVRVAVGSGRPWVIDVPVPEEYRLIPPVAPWEEHARGAGTGRPVY